MAQAPRQAALECLEREIVTNSNPRGAPRRSGEAWKHRERAIDCEEGFVVEATDGIADSLTG
jgi:hypothetical protein